MQQAGLSDVRPTPDQNPLGGSTRPAPGLSSSYSNQYPRNVGGQQPGSNSTYQFGNPGYQPPQGVRRGNEEASDKIARIYREEWQDYLNRFAPYDQKLIQAGTGDLDNQQAIDRARESSITAFDVAQQSQQRDLSRLGVSDNPEERQYRESRTARQRKAAEIDATNRARLHTQDRDQQILTGGAATGLREAAIGGAR